MWTESSRCRACVIGRRLGLCDLLLHHGRRRTATSHAPTAPWTAPTRSGSRAVRRAPSWTPSCCLQVRDSSHRSSGANRAAHRVLDSGAGGDVSDAREREHGGQLHVLREVRQHCQELPRRQGSSGAAPTTWLSYGRRMECTTSSLATSTRPCACSCRATSRTDSCTRAGSSTSRPCMSTYVTRRRHISAHVLQKNIAPVVGSQALYEAVDDEKPGAWRENGVLLQWCARLIR